MQFTKALLFNLLLVLVCGALLYMLFPEQMSGVIEAYGAILGPAGILVILVFALPRRRKR